VRLLRLQDDGGFSLPECVSKDVSLYGKKIAEPLTANRRDITRFFIRVATQYSDDDHHRRCVTCDTDRTHALEGFI
jgi:hypothetical protein